MSALGHDIRGALTPILLAVDCLDADDAADVRAAVERIVTLAAQVDREGAVLEGLRLRCADLEARLAATERALTLAAVQPASNAATVVADSNGEIRSDSDGAVDEIVASDVARFHLERMDDGHWWMRLDLRDGSGLVVNLATKRNAAISALAEREPARRSAS